MRWSKKDKWEGIDSGTMKMVTKFLFIPKRIKGEWRWLERTTYLQMCVTVMNYGSMDYGMHKEWEDIQWIDEIKYYDKKIN